MRTLETITTVSLAACHISPLNPRGHVTDAEIADLATSIRTVGLIQNLAGWQPEPGRIEIVAGGRRLRALGKIAREDDLDPEAFDVPVILAANEEEAREWAKTENIARAALHPADEIAAYRDMAAAGSTPEAIAKAFAVTIRHVKGRLRLAGLAEPILAALGADAITLDVAQAYSIASDPAQQAALFAELDGGYYADNAREIRRRLTDAMVDPRDRLARLVGREAYEAAGGDVREDLFGEDCYFADPDLLRDLALKSLATAREAYLAEGWSWVEAGIERPDWDMLATFGRTYPTRIEASEAEAARYDALADRIECGDVTEAEEREFEALSDRLDQDVFSEAQMALSGVILSVGYDGEVVADHGLVRAEDRGAAEAAGLCHPSRHTSETAERARKGPYSAALAGDLAIIRTGALQAALLEQPQLALDLLTFVLATPIFSASNPVGITTSAPLNVADEAAGQTLPKALLADGMAAPLTGAEAAEAFVAFRRKKPATKSRILTERVARLVSARLCDEGANPLIEQIAGMAGVDIRRTWQPSAWFLNRLTAAQLDAVMAHIRGDGVPGSFAGLKKREKVARLTAVLIDAPGAMPLSEEAEARAAAWLPEGMEQSGVKVDIETGQIAAE